MRAKASSRNLIFLCWLVYTAAYLGRYSYSASVNEIMAFFGVNHGAAGLATTFFFFVYGAGQVVNGLLCRRYHPRVAVSSALLVSALANIAVACADPAWFGWIKYVWLANGAAQSVLWSTLITALRGSLGGQSLRSVSAVMSTTVAAGVFVIYGVSALASWLNAFRLTFLFAGAALLASACVWFFRFNSARDRAVADRGEPAPVSGESAPDTGKRSFGGGFVPIFCFLALFAVLNNLVKDGMTMWVPSILTEKYGMSNGISVLLTLLLPALGILGTVCAVRLSRRVGDCVLLCGLMYAAASLFMLLVLVLLPTGSWLFTLAGFLLVSCTMAGINNIITSMFPLCFGREGNAGLTAGLLDGFCYIGSTISSYGLGSLADWAGWNAVFYVFFVLCLLPVALCIVYRFLGRKKHSS